MRIIIAAPNKEVLQKTIEIFGKKIFNIYLFEASIPITHIDFKFDINDTTFYSIPIKKHEYEFILDIQTADQLVQVLAWANLGLSFDEVKTLLENQNAI